MKLFTKKITGYVKTWIRSHVHTRNFKVDKIKFFYTKYMLTLKKAYLNELMEVTPIKRTNFPHLAIMYHCIPADGHMCHVLPPCFLDIWLEIVIIIFFSFLSADTMCLLREINSLNAIRQRIWEVKFAISSWMDICLVGEHGENWNGLEWTGIRIKMTPKPTEKFYDRSRTTAL